MKKKENHIAVIDNSIDPLIYNPIRHWEPHLIGKWESFRAINNVFPDLSKEYSHLILTGSEISILEREAWVYREIELVREALDKGIPTLGSCYGHQLVALALAGPAHVRRSPEPEIGWISVQITRKNELLKQNEQIFSFSIHFDEVVDLGNDFKVFVSSEKCKIQGFQLKNKPIWGIQMHPEINIPEAQKLLRNLISMRYPTTPLYEEALNSTPEDTGHIRHIMNSFFSM